MVGAGAAGGGCGCGGGDLAGVAIEVWDGRWWRLGASHPPPNLPPKKGGGMNWGRGEGWGVGVVVGGWFLPAQE